MAGIKREILNWVPSGNRAAWRDSEFGCRGKDYTLVQFIQGADRWYLGVDGKQSDTSKTIPWGIDPTLVGGVGKWGNPQPTQPVRPDRRSLRGDKVGSLRLTPTKNGLDILVKELEFEADDAFDFWPGNLGPEGDVKVATTMLAFLEINEEAFDVQVIVNWQHEGEWTSSLEFDWGDEGDADCDPCKQHNPPDDCDDTPRPPSYDPNDIVGPGGFGPEYWISPDQTFHYTVRFENDAQKALAPAQIVRITHPLSTNLDLRTFRLGVMGFGTNLVEVPSDRTFYQTRLNLTNSLGVLLDISASLDLANGEVTWEFFSIDPETGDQPFDPFLGFLPPNTNGIIGQGFVTYTIRPKAGIASGDIINAEARIFFDYNEPMDTPRIFNTVDTGLPTSTVLPLAAITNRNIFPVRWVGNDGYGGAGVGGFDVYVSKDAGPWTLWLANTPYWEQLFVGECGHTYAFRSVARDNVGHVEAALVAAQASISILPNTAPTLEAITNRLIAVGEHLVITNLATDLDLPAQALTFSLDAGAPAGMTIDPQTGVLTWIPACVQGNSVNPVTVRVTDDGCGSESAARSFTLAVTECLYAALGNTVTPIGGDGCVPVHLESSDGLTNLSFVIEVPPGRFTNFAAYASAPEVEQVELEMLTDTQALVMVSAYAGQEMRGPAQVAQVCFTLLPVQASAFVLVEITDIVGLRTDGTPVGNTSGRAGRVAVVGQEPLLEAVLNTNRTPALIVYGLPGAINHLESRQTLDGLSSWADWGSPVTIPTNALWNVVEPVVVEDATLFIRAWRE